MKRRKQSWKNSIFFNEISIMNIEAFLELAICGFLQLQSEAASWLAYVLCFHLVLTVPGLIVWVSSQNLEILQSEKFYDRWGSYYLDFRYQSRASRLYYLYFILKRLFFTFVFYYECFRQRPWLSLIVLQYMNLWCGIYIGHIRPFVSRADN